MRRSRFAVLLAPGFLTVWNTSVFGWGPEPDGREIDVEAITAGDNEAEWRGLPTT